MMDGVDLSPFRLGYTVRYHWVFHYKLFLTIQKLSRWLAANRTNGSTHFNNGYQSHDSQTLISITVNLKLGENVSLMVVDQ